MKKRFFGFLICTAIAIQSYGNGVFAGHHEKTFKSWSHDVFVYAGLEDIFARQELSFIRLSFC